MLDASREAIALARGKTRQDLAEDRILELALTRLVEIVGERNRLVHGYMEIDGDALWSTIAEDLPVLVPLLEAALR